MDSNDLLDKLSQLLGSARETATIEFKSNWDKPGDIAEYISALANSAILDRHDRAWLIWGVDNQTHQVKGTTFDPFNAKAEGNQPLIMWLTQKILPRPDFTFHELSNPYGKVIMLEIHPPRSAPLAFSGVRYIRVDSHKVNLAQHPDKEARLWDALGVKDDWSGELVTEATLDDLDPEAIEAARKRFGEYLLKNEPDTSRHEQIRNDVASYDVATLLNKGRITKSGKITRAALLLLGKDESAHFLSPVDAKISWILRDASNKTESSQHFGIPLILSTDKVYSRIRNVTIEHMPDGTLFPTAIQKYDAWVMREALHNCIAHQDYRLGGKVNLVEHPDRLVFSNLGQFIPPSVEWMLEHQSPPEHYRNQWLIDGMIRLRMIDQVGSGIRRMFETQRERFFPLPDYTFDTTEQGYPRIEVTISGHVLDVKYTQMLMKRSDLELRQVLLLDRVQKHQALSSDEAKPLKAMKLIEGRSPNYFISAKVADWTGQKARYIRNRGLDDNHYQGLVKGYLEKYGEASRKDIDDLLLSKLPDILDAEQKAHKVRNLLQAMRRDGSIHRVGARASGVWKLGPEE
ncbi:RNA-binding domain-containing protein [Methylovorus mays]|uniref:RNA-binding domain-containing protein n=1 Tax=Methylovorus mays TaxID=184077 RepID=UPI001E46FC02|nr:RNA-binding domain-containing protein [Methylovorus mays]MCB5207718.1 putative DNA binding domain-containing protein [Methylovorus mays]